MTPFFTQFVLSHAILGGRMRGPSPPMGQGLSRWRSKWKTCESMRLTSQGFSLPSIQSFR